MAEPRLRTALRVQAMLRMAQLEGLYATVERKGDPDAGGVLVRLRGPGGCGVLSQVTRGDGTTGWLRATGPAPVSAAEADAYATRQVRNDPDLWVVEIEGTQVLAPVARSDPATGDVRPQGFRVPAFIGYVEN